MHAVGVSKREYPTLTGWESHKSKKTKQNYFVWEWNVARPAQDSGDGWTVDKPVGSLGRTPTPGQK